MLQKFYERLITSILLNDTLARVILNLILIF